MDKLISLFKEKLVSLEENYTSDLKNIPLWQIDSCSLPIIKPNPWKKKFCFFDSKI